MNEPERIINGPQSLATSLLTLAQDEMPPAEASVRTLVAMGLTVTTSTVLTASSAKAGVAASALKSATPGLFAAATKWTIFGVCGVALTAGAAREYQAYSARKAGQMIPSPPPRPTLIAPRRDGPELAAAPAPCVLNPAAAAPKRGSERRTTKPAKASEPGEVPVAHSLAQEVAAIDQVRAAAQAHDAPSMLRLLNDYQREFPNGALATEAQVLLVEALVRSGQKAAAIPLGRQLLNAAPSGPHSVRIRALLPELKETDE